MLPAIEQKYKGKVLNTMKMFKIGLDLGEIGLLQIVLSNTTEGSLEFEEYPSVLAGQAKVKYETLKRKMDILQAHRCLEYCVAEALHKRNKKGSRWKITVFTDDLWINPNEGKEIPAPEQEEDIEIEE